jgi:hypothetical protein
MLDINVRGVFLATDGGRIITIGSGLVVADLKRSGEGGKAPAVLH